MWLWIERLGGNVQNLAARLVARLGVRRMADVSQIADQFWTGGALTSAADVDYIVHLGITADADMRLEFDDESVLSHSSDLPNAKPVLEAHPQIAYLYNGVADDGKPKPVSWFETTWNWAEPLLKGGAVVLCHCAAGVNRGPSMTYFLLRAYLGMKGDDAYALITEKRPIAEVGYRKDADEAIIVLGLGGP